MEKKLKITAFDGLSGEAFSILCLSKSISINCGQKARQLFFSKLKKSLIESYPDYIFWSPNYCKFLIKCW